MLTIALPKGALLKDSIELCQKAGLDFSLFLSSSNRQLQIEDPTGVAKALLGQGARCSRICRIWSSPSRYCRL